MWSDYLYVCVVVVAVMNYNMAYSIYCHNHKALNGNQVTSGITINCHNSAVYIGLRVEQKRNGNLILKTIIFNRRQRLHQVQAFTRIMYRQIDCRMSMAFRLTSYKA